MHVYILVLKDWTVPLARFSGSDFPMFFMSFSVAARETYTNKNQSLPDRTGKHWPWVTNTCKRCRQPQFHSFNLFDSRKMKSRSVFLQDDTDFFLQQTCSPEVFTSLLGDQSCRLNMRRAPGTEQVSKMWTLQTLDALSIWVAGETLAQIMSMAILLSTSMGARFYPVSLIWVLYSSEMNNTEFEVTPDNQIIHAHKHIMMDCSSVSEKYFPEENK